MQQQQSTHGQPRAKKSLGQHFLKREDICRRIAMLLLPKPEGYVERERRPRGERGERGERRPRGERGDRRDGRRENRERHEPKDFNDSLDHNGDI